MKQKRTRTLSILFGISGIYGLIVVPPTYAVPEAQGSAALYVYGFAGTALAMQLAYLLIATDPRRYRPLMLIGVAAKLAFAVPAFMLVHARQFGHQIVPYAAVDAALAVAFALAWFYAGARTMLAQPPLSR